MHQGMQERSWSHRNGKKNDRGRHIATNLINVPVPMNSNAKRFLTVETTWLRAKEEPGKLRISLGILQCGYDNPLLPCCWMMSGTARTDRQIKQKSIKQSAMSALFLHFNSPANPYTLCKIKKLTDTPSTTHTLITVTAGGGGSRRCFSLF